MKRKNQKLKAIIISFFCIVIMGGVGVAVSYVLSNSKSNNKLNVSDKKIIDKTFEDKNVIEDIKEQKNEDLDNGFFPDIDLNTKDKMYEQNVYINKKGQAKINKNIVYDVLAYINDPKNLSFFSGQIVYDYKFENDNQKIIIYLGWKYKGEIKKSTSYTFELLN